MAVKECAFEREKALAESLREIASELRLIEAADFVAFIRAGQLGNVRTLVNASTEMYFQPGTISFGRSATAEVPWSATPRISLDMEFHHRLVNVFFRLVLEDGEAGVEIDYISFGGREADPAEDTRRFINALADARITPASSSRISGRAA
jgi:hypothetical protein